MFRLARFLSLSLLPWLGLTCQCSQPHVLYDGGTGTDGSSTNDGGTHGAGPDGSTGPGQLAVQPANKTVLVTVGLPLPTVQYVATLNGSPVAAAWLIDRGEIGSITSAGVFTPSGNLGGSANISASYGSLTAFTSVTVQISNTESGDPNYGDAGPPGAGGYGGVGGNGPGAPTTPAQQTTLLSAPTADNTVQILYPYDQTVWAQGLLAPLLQWNPGAHTFDSVYVHIQETNFEFKGFFGANATPFVNVPIPQGAWDQMTLSALATDTVTVTLIFAQGSTAYGPYTLHWKVAPAPLVGTVYYNSYGTSLVQNSGFGTYPNGTGPEIGGATLSINPGATAPILVAGTPSTDDSGCRVCHTVSANGGFLVTQHGPSYSTSSLYSLNAGNTETVLGPQNIAFAALYPDGTMLFSGSGGMSWGDTASQLYALPGATLLTPTGIPAGLQGTLPAFSPDGTHVAFVFWGGAGADQKSVAAMDFVSNTKTFSNLRTLATPAAGPAAWPSFLPTNDAVVYEVETVTTNEYGFTRLGVHGELWWVDLATHTATRLDALNGKGYLPTNANNHSDDSTLNYEPTVNPVTSGGYAWVVFTSRRIYGDVATMDPFSSDPRNFDLVNNVTTKKLWVAAFDLNATPGTDPSHPAFYLPGQELHAGNSRGFWSLEPCHKDGQPCATGDECCGGYCEMTDGGLECTSVKPVCGQIGDKCSINADCCNVTQGVTCQNGLCTNQPLR
jgi:hypothetical protein